MNEASGSTKTLEMNTIPEIIGRISTFFFSYASAAVDSSSYLMYIKRERWYNTIGGKITRGRAYTHTHKHERKTHVK